MRHIGIIAFSALLLCSCSPKVLNRMGNYTFDREVFKEQYSINKAEWDAVLDFLSNPRLDTLELKKWIQLTPNTRARANRVVTKKTNIFEAHRNVVDVFFMVDGVEQVKVSALGDLKELVRPYNEQKDVEIHQSSDKPRSVILTSGKAVILFPSDAHSPNLCIENPSEIHVVTVKVPFAAGK